MIERLALVAVHYTVAVRLDKDSTCNVLYRRFEVYLRDSRDC
jgi:hypothetical protein